MPKCNQPEPVEQINNWYKFITDKKWISKVSSHRSESVNVHCDSLKDYLTWLIHLNTWSPVGGSIWGGGGAVALLKEVCHLEYYNIESVCTILPNFQFILFFSIPTVKGGDNSVSCFWYHPHHLLLYLFPVVKGANPLEQQDKRNKLFSKLPCHDILLTGRGKVTNTEVGNREQSDALKRLIMMMWGFVCFFLFFLNFHYM